MSNENRVLYRDGSENYITLNDIDDLEMIFLSIALTKFFAHSFTLAKYQLGPPIHGTSFDLLPF